jgi:hypothetical protein
MRFSPHTVYLRFEDGDGVLWLFGGLGPVTVGGALDVVFAHLAFDGARAGTEPPLPWEQFEEHLVAGFGVGLSQRLRGEIPGEMWWCGGRLLTCG